MRRQRHTRNRIAGTLEIEQQRDDGMPVGRDRQLALAALGELAEAGNDLGDQLPDELFANP